MARARAASVQQEALPHGTAGSKRRAKVVLANGRQKPVDLLLHDMQSAPRDVVPVPQAERLVADVVMFDEHWWFCEVCRKAGHGLGTAATKGLVKMSPEIAARRTVSWQALCDDGRRIFIESWIALGIGLPDYAQEQQRASSI